MTLEQKAKAYDETIEKLRNFYRDYDTVSCLIDVKEELANRFPELKESEDEIVRKWIIDYLNNRILNSSILDEKESCKKALAWLEKQGKQPTNEEIIEDVARKVVSDKENAISFLKSNGIMNEDGQLAEEYRTIEADTDKIEQKSDWSKEDEEMLEDVRFNFIYNKEKLTDALIAQYNRFFDKIKSLKPHPQQEWSEEDERIYQSIMDDTVQENQLDNKQTNWLENIKYRLSTRPQNTWKPSKEQLHYLYWIANVRLGDSVVEQEVSKHLNELYNDLKKLKG